MSPFIVGGIFAFLIIVGVVVWVTLEYKKIKWYIAISSGLLASLIALGYAQFGPGMGNTWYRNVGEKGQMAFAPGNIFKIVFEPLNPNAIWLWSPEWWLMNVFVLTPLILIPMTYIIPK